MKNKVCIRGKQTLYEENKVCTRKIKFVQVVASYIVSNVRAVSSVSVFIKKNHKKMKRKIKKKTQLRNLRRK